MREGKRQGEGRFIFLSNKILFEHTSTVVLNYRKESFWQTEIAFKVPNVKIKENKVSNVPSCCTVQEKRLFSLMLWWSGHQVIFLLLKEYNKMEVFLVCKYLIFRGAYVPWSISPLSQLFPPCTVNFL